MSLQRANHRHHLADIADRGKPHDANAFGAAGYQLNSYIMNPCKTPIDHGRILYGEDVVARREIISFDPRHLGDRGILVGKGRGRGFTYPIRVEGNDWVLQYYRRGGRWPVFSGAIARRVVSRR